MADLNEKIKVFDQQTTKKSGLHSLKCCHRVAGRSVGEMAHKCLIEESGDNCTTLHIKPAFKCKIHWQN